MPANQNDKPQFHPGDQAVIDRLGEMGDDIYKPHKLNYYLYFPSKETAEKAAEILKADGFTVQVQLGADDVNWLTLASHSAAPTPDAIAEVRAMMESLASSLEGKYDGWEVEVLMQ